MSMQSNRQQQNCGKLNVSVNVSGMLYVCTYVPYTCIACYIPPQLIRLLATCLVTSKVLHKVSSKLYTPQLLLLCSSCLAGPGGVVVQMLFMQGKL